MPSPSRTNRFQSFTPLRSTTGSLRRLRTAFSPTRPSLRSASPSSITTTSTTSPLTRNSSPHSYRSTGADSSISQLLAVRRMPSVLEFQMEEERMAFGVELSVLEPRPSVGAGEAHVVGIFEVLSGKC